MANSTRTMLSGDVGEGVSLDVEQGKASKVGGMARGVVHAGASLRSKSHPWEEP